MLPLSHAEQAHPTLLLEKEKRAYRVDAQGTVPSRLGGPIYYL